MGENWVKRGDVSACFVYAADPSERILFFNEILEFRTNLMPRNHNANKAALFLFTFFEDNCHARNDY